MKFAFYGSFPEEVRLMLTQVGLLRKHTCEVPADVVFVVEYTANILKLDQAAKLGSGEKPVLVLYRPEHSSIYTQRPFWTSGVVRDIVPIPKYEWAAERIFEALERGDASSLT